LTGNSCSMSIPIPRPDFAYPGVGWSEPTLGAHECDATISAAVIPLQIVGNGFRVGLFDRRAERLDHFGDLGVPYCGGGEWRVHHHVIKAMAATAIGLDLVEAGRFFE